MANSRKLKSKKRPESLLEQLASTIEANIPTHSSVAIGLSGGLDSVVLLHLLHSLAPRFQLKLSAVHIHHGISQHADDWADFCSQLCAQLELPLKIEKVKINESNQILGIEAAARQLRYSAFEEIKTDFIALAHHADDQAETLLLQLLRGSGLKGAASMPILKAAKNALPALLRPLLNLSRQDLLNYATEQNLSWIEDESNADTRYARNFLRHQIFPTLAQKFPAYRETLSRSAQHFAEANTLLDELAQQDSAGAIESNSLQLASLSKLSTARAKNVLRHFIQQQSAPMPHALQLSEILQQLCSAKGDASVCISLGEWEIRRYQTRAYLIKHLPPVLSNHTLNWRGEPSLNWTPLNKNILFKQGVGIGISLSKLSNLPVTIRLRTGGEALRPHAEMVTKTLKNLFQQQEIPPWERDRIPLIYCGETLVCILTLAIQAEFQANPSESSIEIQLEK
jgi:tRNA(Ile)-lysidine synthase